MSPHRGVHNPEHKFAGQAVAAPAQMQACIEECLSCYRVCLTTLQYYLQKTQSDLDLHLVKDLEACVEICHTSARMMMLQSPYHYLTCTACAEICKACAKSCSEIEDDLLKSCAQVCTSCSNSCREMSMDH